MRRTIPLLSGLAILGVVFNHSNWHVLRDFAPGEIGGYPFIVTDQVGKFAIAAFLFIAGYFIAYATNGGKTDLKWLVVRARVLGLLWPWLIWSALMTMGQSFQGRELSIIEFFRNLFIQYYFVPLLIFYYLIAPLVVRIIRSDPRQLLYLVIGVQVIGMVLFYLAVYLPGFPPALIPWIDVGPLQYLRFAIFFPLGLAAGMFPQMVKTPLEKIRPALPWLTLGLFLLSFVESALVYAAGRPAIWPAGGDQTKLTSVLFSTALIACFILFDKISLPLNKQIILMGNRSYGLYLSHYVILGILGKLIRSVLPWLAEQGWLLLPVLFLLTTILAMLLMEIVARLPTRQVYRIVFG